MAKKNYGKQFEQRFREDFIRTFPNEFIMRLKDNTSMYKNASKNPCDFICHIQGKLYMVEVKCHYGNTFPFSALSQYDELVDDWCGLKDVRRCVIIWFIDHGKVLCAPISEIAKMKENNIVSININKYKEYNIIEMDSIMKRVFPEVDYTKMLEVED